MFKITYKGLTNEEKRYKLQSAMSAAKPQDRRGRVHFEILEKDREDVKEHKRKLRSKWLKDREAEITKEIEDADAALEIQGLRLEKNKVVEVPDDHPIVEVPRNKRTGQVLGMSKAQSLADAGVITLVECPKIPEKQPKEEKHG